MTSPLAPEHPDKSGSAGHVALTGSAGYVALTGSVDHVALTGSAGHMVFRVVIDNFNFFVRSKHTR